MGTLTSSAADVQQPGIEPGAAGELKCVRGFINLAVALALNDIVEMVKLPAKCVPVDFTIDTDDLDTNGTPLLQMSAGFTAGTSAEFRAAGAVGRAAEIVRMDSSLASRVVSANAERVVGLKVTAAPATGATTGVLGFTLFYRAARFGE
jgi:hypothetical protein